MDTRKRVCYNNGLGPTLKGKPFSKKTKDSHPSVSRSRPVLKLETEVSRVDWKTEKLTPDQWRFLNRIYAQFAELLTPPLSSSLPLRAVVEFEGILQEIFREFLARFQAPVPMAVFTLDEKNKGLILMDVHLAFAILDSLLGGKGEPIERVREFTEIEASLFRQFICEKFLEAHSEAWKSYKSVNSAVEHLGFSPDSLVAFPHREPVLSSSFLLRLGNLSGSFHLVFPMKFIRESLPRNPEDISWHAMARKSSDSFSSAPPAVEHKIENTNLPVSVELGFAEIPFQDLLGIEAGDLVCLSTSKENPLRVKVEGKTKFLGKPGVSNSKIAVQITEIVEEGDESDEN